MGDLTERCAVLERERADLNVRHIGLSSEYVTEGCGRGASNPHLYEYANKNCRVKQGAGVGGPRRARSAARPRDGGRARRGRRTVGVGGSV